MGALDNHTGTYVKALRSTTESDLVVQSNNMVTPCFRFDISLDLTNVFDGPGPLGQPRQVEDRLSYGLAARRSLCVTRVTSTQNPFMQSSTPHA